MEKFKDISGIMAASEDELKTVEGIGDKQAREIWEFFHKKIEEEQR